MEMKRDVCHVQEVEQFFSARVPENSGSNPTSKTWNADTSASQTRMPLAVDVQEEATAFIFTADVPGVARSDVKVCCFPAHVVLQSLL